MELFAGQTSELVVPNEAKPALRIVKTDSVTGEPLAGVTFTIKKADGATITTEATDQNGEIFLENLDPGVYEVWEQSAPNGYLLNEEHQTITLTPNRTGTVRFENIPKSAIVVEKYDSVTHGQSKGRSGSYSTNWQLTGRELLLPDEVRMLDNQYALLFIRGERPIQDFKYDILKHPNVKLTTDGGAEPYRHGEDTRSIASVRLDPALLEQAAQLDIAGEHDFILLTEEELEEYIKHHGGNTQ